ncbi:mitochondrial chaperone BCS1 [Tieghemostelium lacteum]|uniref:Mitochondrial chaperone BCS1 n=1 Tax=Tieghemostelium lacteum TaxID=361077 RepID=A0A151Z537_TIELA|nr:mitochondrial chaperone BCS1 [Tieghemostelium lacteum]|eukprot:KYQ89027.1 mitochondrial chaperone BCS1 [Tieghemostelium lacteum]
MELNNTALVKGIKSGIGILLIGSCVGLIGNVSNWLIKKLNDSFYYKIDIDSKDKSYEWVMYWLSSNDSIKGSNHLSAETTYNSVGKNPRIIFVPSVGNHRILYKGRSLWVNRVRDPQFDLGSGAPFESIQLTCYKSNKNILEDLIKDAMRLSLNRDFGKTVIYMNDGGSWQRFGNPRTIRSLDSVILADDLKKTVIYDIKEFLNNEVWYRNRGIPYRRGYLLYGPPGNGKSSFITAIAGELNLDICIVSLSQKDMNDKKINQLLNNAPPKSILLIEDIDAAFNKQRKIIEESQSNNNLHSDGLTFSGLLNALDGVASQEGRLLFMTTNKLDFLDEALIRDGRVDLKLHIQNATKQQARQLFKHFYNLDNNSNAMCEKFAQNIQDYQLSMSQIQGFLLKYIHSPEGAIENINLLNPVPIN